MRRRPRRLGRGIAQPANPARCGDPTLAEERHLVGRVLGEVRGQVAELARRVLVQEQDAQRRLLFP